MKTTTITLLHLCLALPAAATATTFNRCEATSGEVTFTQLSCPAGDESSRQRAHNASPGGTSRKSMAMPEPAKQARPSRAQAVAPERKARQPAAAKPAKPEKPSKPPPKQKRKKYVSPNGQE
jgi:hypothetical protein